LARSVPLSRFTSQVGGGSAFFVRPLRAHAYYSVHPITDIANSLPRFGGGIGSSCFIFRIWILVSTIDVLSEGLVFDFTYLADLGVFLVAD